MEMDFVVNAGQHIEKKMFYLGGDIKEKTKKKNRDTT